MPSGEVELRKREAFYMSNVLDAYVFSQYGFSYERTGIEDTSDRAELTRLMSRTDPESRSKMLNPDRRVGWLPWRGDWFWADYKWMGSRLPPDYDMRRIYEQASHTVDLSDFRPEYSGVIDHEAWTHYRGLVAGGDRVALLLWVDWLPARMYMDWLDHDSQFMMKVGGRNAVGGSKKDMARFHLKRYRPMARFFTEDLGMYPSIVEETGIARAFIELCYAFGAGGADWKEQIRGTLFEIPAGRDRDREWEKGARHRARRWKRGEEITFEELEHAHKKATVR